MSGEQPQYRPGDVVNGHMLGADGRWVPLASGPGVPPSYPQGPAGYPQGPAGYPQAPAGYPAAGAGQAPGFAGFPAGTNPQPGQTPVIRYRPGDVANGYVLNAQYQWEPVRADDEAARPKAPPGVVALVPALIGFVPAIGGLFAVLAIILGTRVVKGGPGQTNRDYLLGIVAIVLGALALIGRFIQ